MRLCKHCGEIMKYDEFQRKWKCWCCGMEIEAVTIHGDKMLDEWSNNRSIE